MKDTKQNLILKHLVKFGSITTMEAFQLYRVTRLAAVVFCLKKKGVIVDTIKEHGDGCVYAKYVYGGITNG